MRRLRQLLGYVVTVLGVLGVGYGGHLSGAVDKRSDAIAPHVAGAAVASLGGGLMYTGWRTLRVRRDGTALDGASKDVPDDSVT